MFDGRTFTAGEQADPDGQVAMLNQGLAARLWRGESAVGKRIGIKGQQSVTWMRVVGVMPDVGYGQVGRVTEAMYFQERMVQAAADDLAMDQAEFRRMNFVRDDDFPHRTPFGFLTDSGQYAPRMKWSAATTIVAGTSTRQSR